MNKRDALKLRRGDKPLINNHWNSQQSNYSVEAEVLQVTPNGGIRVRHKNGYEGWTPYNHVFRVVQRVRRERPDENLNAHLHWRARAALWQRARDRVSGRAR